MDLRDQWENEAADFTPWLAEHISLLGETIDMELEVEAEEKYVGPYRADILCRDTSSTSDNAVLVENQLEKTDHSHLGQLLTYAPGLQTATIVWVAQTFTDEHRAALDWLNDITEARFRFFGLEIELWRIDDSPSAPKFNIVAKPNDWVRGIREAARGDLTAKKQLQLEFWHGFRAHLADHEVLKAATPRAQHAMNHAIGRGGFNLSSVFATWSGESDLPGELRVELVLTNEQSDIYFGLLSDRREEAEVALGEPLTWHSREGTRMRRIYARIDADPEDKSKWPEYCTWLQERLEAFDSYFRPVVRSLVADDAPPEEALIPESSGEEPVHEAKVVPTAGGDD